LQEFNLFWGECPRTYENFVLDRSSATQLWFPTLCPSSSFHKGLLYLTEAGILPKGLCRPFPGSLCKIIPKLLMTPEVFMTIIGGFKYSNSTNSASFNLKNRDIPSSK